MTFEKGLIRIRVEITYGKITSLDNVFKYVKKAEIARRTGIGYQRFLYITNNPLYVGAEEADKIAHVLQLTRIEFIKLIYRAM